MQRVADLIAVVGFTAMGLADKASTAARLSTDLPHLMRRLVDTLAPSVVSIMAATREVSLLAASPASAVAFTVVEAFMVVAAVTDNSVFNIHNSHSQEEMKSCARGILKLASLH